MKIQRIEKQLTYRQLSKLTNIDATRLNHIELGTIAPSDAEKQLICDVLGACDFVDKKTAEKNRKAKDDWSDALKKAFQLIINEGRARGVVDCPLCGCPLHYRVSQSNGHIWGDCETERCLSWIQ